MQARAGDVLVHRRRQLDELREDALHAVSGHAVRREVDVVVETGEVAEQVADGRQPGVHDRRVEAPRAHGSSAIRAMSRRRIHSVLSRSPLACSCRPDELALGVLVERLSRDEGVLARHRTGAVEVEEVDGVGPRELHQGRDHGDRVERARPRTDGDVQVVRRRLTASHAPEDHDEAESVPFGELVEAPGGLGLTESPQTLGGRGHEAEGSAVVRA